MNQHLSLPFEQGIQNIINQTPNRNKEHSQMSNYQTPIEL